MGTTNEREVLLGYCDVDSGQILLADPCYIKGDFALGTGAPYAEDAMAGRDPEEWNGGRALNFGVEGSPLTYEGCCKATLADGDGGGQLNHRAGHAGAGVAVRSGFGDGSYPVYATISDEGDWGERVKEVRIVFIGPDDEE